MQIGKPTTTDPGTVKWSRSLEAEYLLRLARVGAVVFGLGVLGFFVLRAQYGNAPRPAEPADEGNPPVLLLENARIVDDEPEIVRARDVLDSANARTRTLAPAASLAPTLDLPNQTPTQLQLPVLQAKDLPLPPAVTQVPEEYLSSSKSITVQVTPPTNPPPTTKQAKRPGQ